VIIVQAEDHAYLVPCVHEDKCVVLKTIFRVERRLGNIFTGRANAMKLDASEKDNLDSVEKEESRSVRGLQRKRYSDYSAATFRKDLKDMLR
jgi:hypothetical protein